MKKQKNHINENSTPQNIFNPYGESIEECAQIMGMISTDAQNMIIDDNVIKNEAQWDVISEEKQEQKIENTNMPLTSSYLQILFCVGKGRMGCVEGMRCKTSLSSGGHGLGN